MFGGNSVHSTLFDFAERGKLGLVSLQQADGHSKIASYINNYESDNYFLKGLGLISQNEQQVLNGARFFYTKTDYMGSTRSVSKSVQYHCAPSVLCLPHVHFGLGKINHYVQNFEVGIAKRVEHTQTWSPIIPNSQLIVYVEP